MTERPILFQGAMVRALLAGTKTQTRRLVKPQPDTRPGMNCTRLIFKDRKGVMLLDEALEASEPRMYLSLCPYGKPGDRLWVRESGAFACREAPIYAADGEQGGWKWAPSIHMPRWASRILLEITEVRVQRLQDISEADARTEGYAIGAPPCTDDPVGWYRRLWDSINAKTPGAAWADNPWVWAVSFQRIEATP